MLKWLHEYAKGQPTTFSEMRFGEDICGQNGFMRLASGSVNGLHPGMKFGLLKYGKSECVTLTYEVEEEAR